MKTFLDCIGARESDRENTQRLRRSSKHVVNTRRIVMNSMPDDPNSGTGKTSVIVKSAQNTPLAFVTFASIALPMVFGGSAYRLHHALSESWPDWKPTGLGKKWSRSVDRSRLLQYVMETCDSRSQELEWTGPRAVRTFRFTLIRHTRLSYARIVHASEDAEIVPREVEGRAGASLSRKEEDRRETKPTG